MTLNEWLYSRYRPTTAKSYQRTIENYLGNHPQAKGAIYKDVMHHIGNLRQRYTNPKTLHTVVSGIKAYYTYLTESNQRTDNPTRSVRLRDKLNGDVQLQDLFTEKELESLVEKEERYPILALRNKVIITLLIYQGLRPKELENLETTDINLEMATVYVRATPKMNARTLPLQPVQILLFHRYLTEIYPKLCVNKVQTKLIIGSRGMPMTGEELTKHIRRTYKGKYKNRKITIQTIRQSVITNLLKAGHDLSLVQTYAGHKKPSTTQQYRESHVEALKNAIQKYHPLK